jgi:hypothetical protein
MDQRAPNPWYHWILASYVANFKQTLLIYCYTNITFYTEIKCTKNFIPHARLHNNQDVITVSYT